MNLSALLSAQPPTVSTFNSVYTYYITAGVAAAVVAISLLIFLAVRYRAKPGAPGPIRKRPEGWKVALVILLVCLAVEIPAEFMTYGGESNITIPTVGDPVNIQVTAFQWGWNFTYPHGNFIVGNLTVPVDETIVLNITSKDVFHSMGIPMFDVKEDAVPGKVNQMWFEATQTGKYTDAIRCFELCGVGHAFMFANLTVVSQTTWGNWTGSSA